MTLVSGIWRLFIFWEHMIATPLTASRVNFAGSGNAEGETWAIRTFAEG
jgi:hypothetical protein